MQSIVEPWLATIRTEEQIKVKDGFLHAENYILPGSNRAIVMLHGYTESAEKLREMTWYFLKCGFSVFSYDQRGHGRSIRHVEDESITHVRHFSDYIEDLDTVINDCARKQLPQAELMLFAHSMGGAVGAHYLIEHPDVFSRAVLSSPMIAPSAGQFPLWFGGLMAGTMTLAGQGSTRAFIGHDFDAASETFQHSCTSSPVRFTYYTAKRAVNRYLQNCSPTYRWTYEAVHQMHSLLSQKNASKIKAEVLLCQAGLDDVVLLPPQERFISLVPSGKLIRYEQTKHEIYNSTDDVMRKYVADILSFYGV